MTNSVLSRIEALMRDGQPRTLEQIRSVTGGYPTAVSAKLRQLRSRGYEVRSWRDTTRKGVWLYHVSPAQGQLSIQF